MADMPARWPVSPATPDAAVNAFTLMKVIGRDIWIGVWAFVLSIVATTCWQTDNRPARTRGQIWRRFPKFVLGFLAASLIITVVARGYSYADYQKLVLPSLVTSAAVAAGVGLHVHVPQHRARPPGSGISRRSARGPSMPSRPGSWSTSTLGYVLSTQVFVDFWTRLGQ